VSSKIKSLERETPAAMCQGTQVFGGRKSRKAGNGEGATELDNSSISLSRKTLKAEPLECQQDGISLQVTCDVDVPVERLRKPGNGER